MKASLTCLILSFSFQVFSFGWSDWESTTPGGNIGDNYSGSKIALHINNETIHDVHRLYFYKNHIIGEIAENPDKVNAYFIVDEKQNSIFLYENKTKWTREITNRSLTPKVWTRWYTSDWYLLDDWNIMMFPFYLIVILPLKVLYLTAILRVIKREKFRFFKPYTTISTTIAVVLILVIWLEIYPQSI